MTFRARPTTRTGRRGGHESDARRNLYFTVGFGAVVVLAVALLVGAGAASWYDDHMAPVARVNGDTITKDMLRDRVGVESWRWSTLESRTREKVNAGRMSEAQGQQLLNYISSSLDSVGSTAYENEIDTALILQLAPTRNIEITEADIDAQVTEDATTPESRHAFAISVAPETSEGATEPTQAQKDAAKKKAEDLLADLKAGTTWEEVVKASGDADAAETNGDLYYIDEGSTAPDTAFVEAIFALAEPGYTGVIEGADGTFRVGRLTDIAEAVVDTNYMQRATAAGVNEATYRRAAASIVAYNRIQEQIIAEVVDKPSEQRRTSEIVLEDNSGAEVPADAILVRHLLYAPEDDAEAAKDLAADDPAWAAAETEARAAYDKLKAGTSRFVDLAPDSDDSGSAASNGFLPYYSPGDAATLDPAFADAIFAEGLLPGQLLEPVKSQFGWHVIQVVSTDPPAVRAQKVIAEASKPGVDFAALAAEESIASSAADGGDLGWVARYQLGKEQEDVIFATQANGVSSPIEVGGLAIYKVTEIANRTPDEDQAATLRNSAFANWYGGIKEDPAQTTIERLLDTGTGA